MLYLSLFGNLTLVRVDGSARSDEVDVGGRPGSLLAYLALARGRFFSRSSLIATLWSGPHEPIGLGTFNTTLWRLRKALERPPLAHASIVVCDRRGAIGLPDGAALEVDVSRFTSLVAPSLHKPMEQLDEADIANLRCGVRLYRDDILAGFADDWALREREIHRRMMLNALGRLMQLCVLAQDHAGATAYAQDILDRDPLREDIHRELMRLYLVSGQRAMALRQFEVCRASLRRELAIQPMRETLAVYQQIADSAVGRNRDPPQGVSAQHLTHDTPSDPRDAMASARGTLSRSARELIVNARHYLANADAQLQQSLPLLDDKLQGTQR